MTTRAVYNAAYRFISENKLGWPENGLDELTDEQDEACDNLALAFDAFAKAGLAEPNPPPAQAASEAYTIADQMTQALLMGLHDALLKQGESNLAEMVKSFGTADASRPAKYALATAFEAFTSTRTAALSREVERLRNLCDSALAFVVAQPDDGSLNSIQAKQLKKVLRDELAAAAGGRGAGNG